MFAITGFYHRYFSHKTYKTSRVAQFIFGLIGTSATQRGPLWWAAHHRKHHKHSDDEHDVHSPRQHGLLWSHMLWFTTRPNFPTDLKYIPDMAKYPELRFLDRFDILPPVLLAVSCLLLGIGLNYWFPGLETSGAQMLIWGFFISTVVLFHATCTINSLSHMIGKQRYETGDDSRNSWFLAILTFGEGWHNNHHHYPHSVRQGFRWWEYDFTFYALWVMSKLGIIWDMRAVPERLKTDDPQPTVARTSSDDNPDPDTKREKAA
jgi:stearoyl-CoA desaturase (delta-9 desaturase)